MQVTCAVCGAAFEPAFVYQLAVVGGQRRTFCTVECRRRGLGDEGFRPPRRARRIAVLNQKGGTGKTTTAISLAAGLAERGEEVLLVDTDSQGNVGASLGVRGERTLAHVLVDGVDPADAAVPVRKGLDVITSDARMADAERWLARHEEEDRAARVLAERLRGLRGYGWVVLDCGPSLSFVNQNALLYADEVVVPVACDYLGLVGVKQVLATLKALERQLGHSVRVSAILPTFFDGRTRLSREAYETLREHFRERCLEPVRTSTRLAEAPAQKKTIFEHAPDSHGARDYERVVGWLLGTGAGAAATGGTAKTTAAAPVTGEGAASVAPGPAVGAVARVA